MGLFNNIKNHVKQGTLLRRIFRGPIPVVQKPDRSPVGDAYHGADAENYLENRVNQDYWHLEQKVIGELIETYSSGIRVLDMPVGTGRFVPFYLQKKMDVFGLDASADMIAVAQRELGQEFDRCQMEVGDALNLPYKDDFFDLVVCFRFLSHVLSFSDAKHSLKELARVGRSQFLLQFRVRRDDVSTPPDAVAHEAMHDRFTCEMLKQLLLDAGLETKQVVFLEEREVYHRAVFVCIKE